MLESSWIWHVAYSIDYHEQKGIACRMRNVALHVYMYLLNDALPLPLFCYPFDFDK